MKKIILLLVTACIFQLAIAQQPLFVNNPYPKTISVSGSAEMEIIPDEIYVNVELSEYQKKGDPKKDIETIKTNFLESCKAAGIPDSVISIVSYSGNNNYYFIRKRKKNTDLFANITYQVKFKSSKLMDDLVEKLDDNATQNFLIVSVSHSRMTEFRRQLKIKAIQAAKDKGIYLTDAVGEKLGEAITINEPGEWQPYRDNNNYLLSNAPMSQYSFNTSSTSTPETTEVDFKKIKLRFEVSVVFALK
jgi:uncharacterized protein YggE